MQATAAASAGIPPPLPASVLGLKKLIWESRSEVLEQTDSLRAFLRHLAAGAVEFGSAEIASVQSSPDIPANMMIVTSSTTELRSFVQMASSCDELLQSLLRQIESAPPEVQLSREAMADMRNILEAYIMLSSISSGCQLWAEVVWILLRSAAGGDAARHCCDRVAGNPCSICAKPFDVLTISHNIVESWTVEPVYSRLFNRVPMLRAPVAKLRRLADVSAATPLSKSISTVALTIGIAVLAGLCAFGVAKSCFGGQIKNAQQAVADAAELASYKHSLLRDWDKAADEMVRRGLQRPVAMQTGDMVVALPRSTLMAEFERVRSNLSEAQHALRTTSSQSVSVGTICGVASAWAQKSVLRACSSWIEDTAPRLQSRFGATCTSLQRRVNATLDGAPSSTHGKSTTAAALASKPLFERLFGLSAEQTMNDIVTPLSNLEELLGSLKELYSDALDILGFVKHVVASTSDSSTCQCIHKIDSWFTQQGLGVEEPRQTTVPETCSALVATATPFASSSRNQRWKRLHLSAILQRHNSVPSWIVWESYCVGCTDVISPATTLVKDDPTTLHAIQDDTTSFLCARKHVFCSKCAVSWLHATQARSRHHAPELVRRERSPVHDMVSRVAAWLRGEDLDALRGAKVACPCCRRDLRLRPYWIHSPFRGQENFKDDVT